MSSPNPSAGRGLLVICLFACLAVAACGRRGAPEAPPDPSAPVQQKKAAEAKPRRGQQARAVQGRKAGEAPDSGDETASGEKPAASTSLATTPGGVTEDTAEDEGNGDSVTPAVSPQPTPPRRRTRIYTVPKEPFILDPLL